MSLVFASITPHPPLIIPAIGKENLNQINKTINAFKTLEENLYSAKPDTIIIFSPHGPMLPNTFTMNLSPSYKIQFEEFGDFSTKVDLKGDVGLAYQIKEKIETKTPFQAISEEKLDYGCGVPLALLTPHLPNIQVIPIYPSGIDYKAHCKFGKILKSELLKSRKRIAVIASGDLSHRITKDAPAGYSPKGAEFDKKIISYLTKRRLNDILNMNHILIHDAGECGLKSIAIILGIIEGIEYTPEVLSYEAPFGVGYLAMNFNL